MTNATAQIDHHLPHGLGAVGGIPFQCFLHHCPQRDWNIFSQGRGRALDYICRPCKRPAPGEKLVQEHTE